MRTLQGFIDQLQAILDDPTLPGVDHSMYVLSARQQMAGAIANLQQAPTDRTVALERLKARYVERQAETFPIREGLAVSLRETTATTLNALQAIATSLVQSGAGDQSFWIDDGENSIDITAQEIVDNSLAYTALYAQNLLWVSAMKKAIEASEDPLAVPLA